MLKARQCLFPLRRLKKFGMGPQILERFHSCTIESISTGCITAWYGNSTALDHMVLQSVVQTTQYIAGAELPAIQDLYISGVKRRPGKLAKTPSLSFSLLSHIPQNVWSNKNSPNE